MPPAIDLEIRKQVVRAYADDDPIEDIADEYGVSKQAVVKWAKAAGLSRNAPRTGPNRNRRTSVVRVTGTRSPAAQLARCEAALAQPVARPDIAPATSPRDPYRIVHGEKESVLPGVCWYLCRCGTRSDHPDGHERCRAAA